jgi:hypothetical protein
MTTKCTLWQAVWLSVVLTGAGVSAQERVESDNSAASFRARLSATPIGTDLVVTVVGGEVIQGPLADVAADAFAVWVTPDAATREHVRLISGRLQKRISYQDVAAIQGASIVALSGRELAYRMRLGDTVYLRTGEGKEVHGRLEDFDGDRMRVGSSSFRLSSGEVERIDMKVDDSVANGALIGLGIGGGYCALVCATSGGCSSEDVAAAVIISGGAAGLGALFDALHKTREVIYVSPSAVPKQLTVSPLWMRDRKEILVSLRF